MSPNEEFQTQITTFSNAINELTTFALMNRVPMPISRDILELNDVIIKCNLDRLRNLDPRNDRPALRTEFNVFAVVPLTDGGFDSSIRRGNLRPMGSSLHNSVDHLYEGGDLRRVPMPVRRSLTVLNSIRDITMSAWGEIIDNDGQRSPRYSPTRIDDLNVSRGEIIDNVGQQSPRSILFGNDDVYVSRGEVIDNVGQQSPQPIQFDNGDVYVSRGEVIDNVGQRSPKSLQSRVDDIRVYRGEVIDNVGQRYVNPREGF